MNRLLTVVTEDACPHCVGRELAEHIAHNHARHPLGPLLMGKLFIMLPPQFGFIGGQMFIAGVCERLAEISKIRVTCN